MQVLQELDITGKDLWLLLWGALLSTLLAAPISYFFYRRALTRKILCCARSAAIILTSERTITDLDVFFDGIPVANLLRFRFVIWNGGNQTIEGSEIITSSPLQISFDRTSVGLRGVQLKYQTRSETGASILENGNELIIQFRFLDPGDGFIIDAFAEAVTQELETAKRRAPSLTGVVKGMPNGVKQIDGSVSSLPPNMVTGSWLLAISSLGIIFEPVYYLVKAPLNAINRVFLVVLIAMMVGSSLLILSALTSLRSMPRRLKDENTDLTNF